MCYLELIESEHQNWIMFLVFTHMPKGYIRHEYNQDSYNLCDEQLKKRYRFSKNTMKNVILPLIGDKLSYCNNRGLPIIFSKYKIP